MELIIADICVAYNFFITLQTERPDAILGVICGAVHVAEAGISKRYVNFKSALERYSNALKFEHCLMF